MQLFELAKAELYRSNVDRHHPFKIFGLSTINDGFPEARTVVKRHVDADLNIFIYSDSRAKKVGEIKINPRATALFYHPKKKLQLRIKSEAIIVESEAKQYTEHLHKVKSNGNLNDYKTALAPGSATNTTTYSNELHFSLIKLIPVEMDVLLLDANGHLRCKCTLKDGKWIEQALVP